MKLTSNNVINGKIAPQCGKFGEQFIQNKMPSRSLHLAWRELPDDTQSLAVVMLDHDAIPVCGFTWIHWAVANIDPTLNELTENTSVDSTLIEGINSWGSGLLSDEHRLDETDATAFGGCAPPDKPHHYTITLYALDIKLPLVRGFHLNKLYRAMDGHILETATLMATYDHE